MTKVMKNLCILALIAGVIMFAGEGWAQDAADAAKTEDNGGASGFFGEASARFIATFQSVRTMVLIFGGFGLIVLAIAAILGKIKWAALGALAAGLAIVAVAGKVVDYATGKTAGDISTTTMAGSMDL